MHSSTPPQTHEDRRNLVLSAGLVLLCVLATLPFLEMGVNDDWSYAYTTRELAATGLWHYTGWTSPMLGVQALVGALVVRVVGFSFTVLRLTTSVFAVGCAVLLYRLARVTGLKPSFALFATLASVLSPLFIPLAASFMTDVPAFFFLLACLYGGALAVERRHGLLWLTISAVAGVLGGTVRQVVWGAPLLMIPAIIWLKRKDRGVVAVGPVIYAAVAVTIWWCLRWSARQEYLIVDAAPGNVWEFFGVIRNIPLAAVSRTLLILVLPVLVIHVVAWWRLRRFASAPQVAAGFCVMWTAMVLPSHQPVVLGNVISPNGVLKAGTEALGIRPVIVSNYVLFGLAFAAAGALVVSVALMIRVPPDRDELQRGGLAPGTAGWLFGPFFVASLVVLLYRSGSGLLVDRHLIFMLPALSLPLLWAYERKVAQQVPMVGWAVLCVYTAYGVATTHDYLASARARLAAATAITRDGVPRTAISAGFEYDGWTELEARGYVNEPRMAVPSDGYRVRQLPTLLSGSLYWFWTWTPSIAPKYFVVYTPQWGLVDAKYPPVSYSVWLPPSTRHVLTQTIAARSGTSP